MYQHSLPGLAQGPAEKVVNVASVKHRSPFRYPGGKTWLVPRIIQWFARLPERPRLFVEPFAGGAIVGLTVAFENLSDAVLLADLDEQVAAVWNAIINQGDGPWLAEQIAAFDPTEETVDRLLSQTGLTPRWRAFQTIVKNRVNRGGILAEGAGRLKYGENGKGLRSRWYPTTLQKRILDLNALRERLNFVRADGLEIVQQYRHREDVVFFIDPPYTASEKKPGSRLYDHWRLDHVALFALASQVQGDVLMTYDNVAEVREMADRYGFDAEAITMKNTHHARQSELLIGKNLDWLRE
jgi:DNA adenine methylase